MTKKIAIATMVGQNYGNRLQNYALQLMLESIADIKVETLLPTYGPSSTKSYMKQALRHLLPYKRWARFSAFDSKYIHYSNHRMDDNSLSHSDYELFIIGSDQVWNPTFDITSDAEFLPQIEKAKKASYAASFGVDSILDNRTHIAQLLENIDSISVREITGQTIVYDLTGRHAELVLDPTMLLSKQEWLELAQKPDLDIEPGNYLLKYALGENVPNGINESSIDDGRFQIVDLKKVGMSIGPAEFVWLIANAYHINTDSFHATVFALLFHKSFNVYRRQSNNFDMSSRFDTLCKLFSLESMHSKQNARLILSSPKDWLIVDNQLDFNRASSLGYLSAVVNNAI